MIGSNALLRLWFFFIFYFISGPISRVFGHINTLIVLIEPI